MNTETQDISVLSVNSDDMTVICSDGSEYPLVDGLEDLDIENLQDCMNTAKRVTMKILEDISNYAG